MTDTKGMKKSVYLSGTAVDAITARYKQGDENYSEAINLFADRYRVMVAAELADMELDASAWKVLFSIYNGTATRQDAAGTAKMLLAEVADSEEGQLHPTLFDTVKHMNLGQRLAIIDMCERFWCGSWDDYADYDAIIDELIRSA